MAGNSGLQNKNKGGYTMDFLRNVTRDIGKKSGQLVEITRLTAKIAAEENKVKKIYAEMGHKMYEDFRNGESFDDKYMVMFSDISILMSNIEELRQEVLEVKGVSICRGCGAEVPSDSKFCTKCGSKIGENPDVNINGQKVCHQCGAVITDEDQFCPECGTTLD